jgi:hypothetical protein
MDLSDPGSGAFLFCSDEASIHARLRQNDPEDSIDLQLWLNAASNIPDLTDALWHNTSVQEVLLLIHESFGRGQPEHEVLLLFAVLGRLPRLSRLYFNTYRFPFVATLPVRCFANVFRSARNLVEFKLWRTDLLCVSSSSSSASSEEKLEQQGQQQNEQREPLEAWAMALASTRSLQEFRLIKCRLTTTEKDHSDGDHNNNIITNTDHRTRRRASTGTHTQIQRENLSSQWGNQSLISSIACPCSTAGTLDPVLQALAKLPHLLDVELSATTLAALGNLSQTTLRQILRAPSLQTFSLSNFDLSEEACVIMAQTLLYQERGALVDSKNRRATDHASRSSRSATDDDDDDYATNADNKHQSSTVQSLRLANVGSTASMFTKPIREAFQQTLQYNYRLERLFLFDSRNLQQEIDFYMKLNRLGRGRLLQHPLASRKEWVETLVHVRHDLDCLFYFLSIHPLQLRGCGKDGSAHVLATTTASSLPSSSGNNGHACETGRGTQPGLTVINEAQQYPGKTSDK